MAKQLQATIKAIVRPGDQGGFVVECVEIPVVTQGRTLDETIRNLKEAVSLHLEGEKAEDYGLRDRPTLVVTIEIEPDYAEAS